MDIITTPPYEELQKLYSKYFSLGYMNTSFTNKVALISLICYITEQLKTKKPDVTHFQIIRKLGLNIIPEDVMKGLAVVCSDFAYGCSEFPTFDISDKKIPSKIKELLKSYIPFQIKC